MRRFSAILGPNGLIGAEGAEPYVVDSLQIFFRGYVANTSDPLIVGDDAPAPGADHEQYWARCFARAYRKWGARFGRRVLGEYAVAIYDAERLRIVLAHDTLGVIPLFYRRNREGLAFASHLDLLAPVGGDLAVDEEYVADYLCFGDHHGERTAWEQIKRLRVGEALDGSAQALSSVDNEGIRLSSQLRYARVDEYAEHLREVLSAGVAAATRGGKVTWCELSGGLDSSTVASVASRLPSRPANATFSFTYSRSAAADETRWIRAVSEACGLRAYQLDADDVRPFARVPIERTAEPEHAIINDALYRAYDNLLVENNVGVVLTGMGGDASLLGDGPEPFFFADLLRAGRVPALATQLRHWITNTPEQRPARFWIERCIVTAGLRHMRRRLIQDRPPMIPWLSTGYLRGTMRNGQERRTWVPYDVGVSDSWFLERVLRSANVVATWGFRSSMRAEFRHPLLYVPLVELMLSIPPEVKFSPSTDRVLQRAAFANVLPEAIVERKTKAGPDQRSTRDSKAARSGLGFSRVEPSWCPEGTSMSPGGRKPYVSRWLVGARALSTSRPLRASRSGSGYSSRTRPPVQQSEGQTVQRVSNERVHLRPAA